MGTSHRHRAPVRRNEEVVTTVTDSQTSTKASPADLAAQSRPRPSAPAVPAAPVVPERCTGAQSLVKSLEAIGVDTVFGLSLIHISEPTRPY